MFPRHLPILTILAAVYTSKDFRNLVAVELIRSSEGASFVSSSKVSPAVLITFTIS